MTKFEEYCERQRRRYGDKFTTAQMPEKFVRYYNSGERVKVRTTYGETEVYERTGTISTSTGWAPIFLLMRRVTSLGSSDVLGERDEIVAVKRGRKYVEV